MDHRGDPAGVRASGTAIDYQQIRRDLLTSYEGGAERRDQYEKQPWKLAERNGFARRLLAESCTRLLEIGAGTGQDSEFFARRGLQVVATDLSPAMVARCRQKGIDARVMDFAHLEFQPPTFDAVHAMNCLLHVPNAELPSVLAGIRDVLRVGGLFFVGVYSAMMRKAPQSGMSTFPLDSFPGDQTNGCSSLLASRSTSWIFMSSGQAPTTDSSRSLCAAPPSGLSARIRAAVTAATW